MPLNWPKDNSTVNKYHSDKKAQNLLIYLEKRVSRWLFEMKGGMKLVGQKKITKGKSFNAEIKILVQFAKDYTAIVP